MIECLTISLKLCWLQPNDAFQAWVARWFYFSEPLILIIDCFCFVFCYFLFQDKQCRVRWADEASVMFDRAINGPLKGNLLIHLAYANFEEVRLAAADHALIQVLSGRLEQQLFI